MISSSSNTLQTTIGTPQKARQSRRISSAILLLLFAAIFLLHFCSKNNISYDSKWSIHLALSILKEGNTTLDEYYQLPPPPAEKDYAIEIVDGHAYNVYPVGPSLLALPFVAVMDAAGVDVIRFHEGTELLIASALIAFTSVLLYLIARMYLSLPYTFLLIFIFAFCTSAWSGASRALWQHGPSMLVLTLALYLLLLARTKPWLVQFVSVPLAFAYITRPTNSLSVIMFTILVFLHYRRYFLPYVLWALPIALPFFLYNFSIYHTFFSPYYRGISGLGFSLASLQEGLAGTLFSPSRGLFVFTPVLLFSLYGIFLKIRGKQFEPLDFFVGAVILLHWLTISIWAFWWAGHSYGPRIFSDVLPYFIFFLIPVLQNLPKFAGWRKYAFVGVFVVLIAFSFFVHYRGAMSYEAFRWNSVPNDVNENLYRLWDWKDPQFLRGV